MTKRREITPAPEPLEAYAKHFDEVLRKSNQREEFRRYLEGLLLPTQRHKTLTGLVNTEPLVGAQLPRAQKLQWFLTESTWDEREVGARRLSLLRTRHLTLQFRLTLVNKVPISPLPAIRSAHRPGKRVELVSWGMGPHTIWRAILLHNI
jgi:DDE superfamily endonuclease